MFEVPFLQSSVFFDYHLSCFHRRSVELQRAGSGLLDKVITDTRSLKQIPLTEFSSDKDSGKWSFFTSALRLSLLNFKGTLRSLTSIT